MQLEHEGTILHFTTSRSNQQKLKQNLAFDNQGRTTLEAAYVRAPT